MKSRSKKRAPNIVNLTVKRRYLTEREVERLMDCARKHGRYGRRNATMILVAYRHGLRASEVCDLQWQVAGFSTDTPREIPGSRSDRNLSA
jgi:integrase